MTQFGDSIKEVNIKGFNPVDFKHSLKKRKQRKSLSVNIQKENFQIEFP